MNKFSIAFVVYRKIYVLPSLSLSCVYEDMKIFNNHLSKLSSMLSSRDY